MTSDTPESRDVRDDSTGDATTNAGSESLGTTRAELVGLLDLVRSWQHRDKAHLRGCPATTYYIAACSKRCVRAIAIAAPTPDEIARFPVSGSEFARSSISSY